MEPDITDFDVAGARAEGYSDDEINAYLRQRAAAKTQSAPTAPDVIGRPLSRLTPERAKRSQQLKARLVAQQNVEDIKSLPLKATQAAAVPMQAVPGGEAVQAFVRSLSSRRPYAEELQNLRRETAALPTAVRLPLQAVGAGAAAAALPGSMAAQQAGYGALMGATEASPDVGIGERAFLSAAQAGTGYMLGKVLGNAGTATKVATTPTRAELLLKEQSKQSAAADPLYKEFRSLGELPMTPELENILNLPIVRQAANAIKRESPVKAKLPITDAEMLDAIYKRIGNKAFTAKFNYEPDEARIALKQAIDDASGGAYSPAVEAFEAGAKRMEAVQRGARAGRPAAESMRSAIEESPEALREWAKTASPDEVALAAKGLVSGLRERGMFGLRNPKQQVTEGMFTRGPSLSRATEILRMMGQKPGAGMQATRGVLSAAAGRPLQDLFYTGR